jgi:hypothetical protein
MKKLLLTALLLVPQMQAMQMKDGGSKKSSQKEQSRGNTCCATTKLCGLTWLLASASIVNGQPAYTQIPAHGGYGNLAKGPAGDYTDYGRLLEMRAEHQEICNQVFSDEIDDIHEAAQLEMYEMSYGRDAASSMEWKRLEVKSTIRAACKTLFWEVEQDKEKKD